VLYLQEVISAKISGDIYLGVSGAVTKIALNDINCSISSIGVELEQKFELTYSCANKHQILWNETFTRDLSLDEPQFSLIRAGDFDDDGKIDIEMEMSPKYSCKQQVIYLSSQASSNELVGISNVSKLICGG